MKTKANLRTRWLVRRDMQEVLAIENQSFEFAWTEEDFLCCLRQRNCIGMVADVVNDVLGYMIYELDKDSLRLLNLAVHPAARRQGVGSAMLDRLKEKLSQQRRKRIVLQVRETNVSTQVFLRRQGFFCVGIEREFYEDTHEDSYTFRYSLRASEDIYSPTHPTNRVSEYLKD